MRQTVVPSASASPADSSSPSPESDGSPAVTAAATALSPQGLIEPSAAGSPDAPPLSEVLIRPRKGWIGINVAELLHFRELLYFLIWRDVKVRYKQAVLGFAWVFLQPLFGIVVFTVVFGNFAGMKTKLPPDLREMYAVFVCAGLIPWTLFSRALNDGGMSLVAQQNMLTKIYFPRLFVPSAVVGSALFDMLVSFGILAGLMVWFHVPLTPGMVLLPGLVALNVVAALGIALVLSALTVSYRDFRFVIPFMTQAWMYVSPVIYPVRMFPEKWQWVLAVNPMTGVIEGFRAALFEPMARDFNWGVFGISTCSSVALFVFGLFYFRKTERRFADIA